MHKIGPKINGNRKNCWLCLDPRAAELAAGREKTGKIAASRQPEKICGKAAAKNPAKGGFTGTTQC